MPKLTEEQIKERKDIWIKNQISKRTGSNKKCLYCAFYDHQHTPAELLECILEDYEFQQRKAYDRTQLRRRGAKASGSAICMKCNRAFGPNKNCYCDANAAIASKAQAQEAQEQKEIEALKEIERNKTLALLTHAREKGRCCWKCGGPFLMCSCEF